MIPQDFINRVLAASSIEKVIGEHVKLKKAGVNYSGCCPFHAEKTASFVVSPAKGIYKCFGCGVAGNAISFVQNVNAITFAEAIKVLADKASLTMPAENLSDSDKAIIQEREKLLAVNAFAAKFYQNRLSDSAGYTYMLHREFGSADMETFAIGFAPNAWNDFRTVAEPIYGIELLIRAGLLTRNDDGKVYDKFRNRVLFPIFDNYAHVVGFTGRALGAEDKPKYLNTSDTDVFHKGRLLFGLHQARTHIVKQGFAVLVEGNTDVMRFHKVGVKNTVATSGTALTTDHARLLHRYTNRITIIFDGDNAGIKATMKGLSVCLAEGLSVYVVILPPDQDPDSFAVKMDEKSLYDWIERTEVDFITHVVGSAKKTIEERPAEKAQLISDILDLINCIPDNIARQTYYDAACGILGLDIKAYKKEVKVYDQGWKLDYNRDEIRAADNCRLFNTIDEAIKSGVDAFAIYPSKNIDDFAKQLIGLNRNFDSGVLNEKEFMVGKHEHPKVQLLAKLTMMGATVACHVPRTITNHDTGEIEDRRVDEMDFITYYMQGVFENCDTNKNDEKSIAMQRTAKFLAHLDNATLSLVIKEAAKMYGVSVTDFRQILSQFQSSAKDVRRKSVIEVENTSDLDDDQIQSQSRYGLYFKHNRIFFQNKGGGVDYKSNFIIEPLLHTNSTNNSRKIFRITNIFGEESLINISTNELNNLVKFNCSLEDKGNYNFTGEANHLKTLKAYLYDHTTYCNEVEVYGWQRDGHWTWSSGISTVNQQYIPINDYGLAEVDKKRYFIKPFSKLYSDDEAVFINEKKFARRTSDLNLVEWAKEYIDVFGSKSALNIAAMVTTIFGDYIFSQLNALPLIFLFGPKGTGKTEQAYSIQSVFADRIDAINLTKVTPYAASYSLKVFRNSITIFDEYKNVIGMTWIEFLKSLYNRQPRVRGSIKEGVEIESIPVNSMVFVAGQEMPTLDVALMSRAVFLAIYNTSHTPQERTRYEAFKAKDAIGKSHFVEQIIKYRALIEDKFNTVFIETMHEIADICDADTDDRLIKNYATIITPVRILQPYINFPFSVDELKRISAVCIREQMNIMSSSNEIGQFWSILIYMLDNKIINAGSNFIIKDFVTIDVSVVKEGITINETLNFGSCTKGYKYVLMLRWDGLYQSYANTFKGKSEPLPENTLQYYLEHHKAFLGKSQKKVRFGSSVNRAWCFDYELLGVNLIRTQYQDAAGNIAEIQSKIIDAADIMDLAEPNAEGINKKAGANDTPDDLPF